MARTIHTDKAPAATGPYIQGKVVGNFLFALGQVLLSSETGEIIGAIIQEQTKQALRNISAILAEAGIDLDYVVKTTYFLSDMSDFVPFSDIYATAFKADLSARSAVEVARLPKDVKVEIEVIAYLDQFYFGPKPGMTAANFRL